jgi:hypothetical protein
MESTNDWDYINMNPVVYNYRPKYNWRHYYDYRPNCKEQLIPLLQLPS